MFDFDEDFILALKGQDHTAFNTFYIKSVDIFFRYIQNHYFVSEQDTNDIISNFYVKQRDAFKNYDPKQSFSAYVWTIFKNNLKDYFKKMTDLPFSVLSKDKETEAESFEQQIEDDSDILELLEQNFKFEQIEKAMNQLDSLSKDIIYLRFIEEKSTNEIADILQLSNDNVRQKVSRGLKHLKTLLVSG